MTSRLLRALRPRRGGRLPLALLALVVAAGVTAAVSEASAAPGGLRFAPFGHWFAQPKQNTVFHVNSATGEVDAQFRSELMPEGTQVVQGETAGYVLGEDRALRFDKSNLEAEEAYDLPPRAAQEVPVSLEARGGPYAIYPEQGRIVRFSGDEPVVIPAGPGGPLGPPVVTPDGTLWLQHIDSNGLCSLAPDAEHVDCRATAPAGHAGTLTVVGKQAVFVDTDADTFTPVGASGLGDPVKIGRDLPADAKVATTDMAGRVAVLDPGAGRMHILDASGLGQGRVSEAATVALPDGQYDTPVAGRDTVALFDQRGNTLRTYGRDGRTGRSQVVNRENKETRLSRGEDQRVYVESGLGNQVIVVGEGGRLDEVRPPRPRLDGKDGNQPVPPPVEKTTPPATTGGTQGGPTQQSDNRPSNQGAGNPDPGRETNRPQTQTPRTQQPKPNPTPKRTQTTNPPTPPGLPPGLRASVSGGNIVVRWGAAAKNGAAVSGYRVTWSGGSSGSRTVGGGSRSTTLSGLTRAKNYRITVAAQNSAGRGTAASTRVLLPAAASTRSVSVSRGSAAKHEPDCLAPRCGHIRVTIRGFTPNSSVDIEIYSSKWGNFNGADLSTDEKGNLTVSNHFAYNGTGGTIWATVDGVSSNRLSSW